MKKRVHIIGAGAWGRALALTAERAGSLVALHSRLTQAKREINSNDILLLAAPAQKYSEICQELKEYVAPNTPLVICSKGIEAQKPYRLLSEIARSYLQNPLWVLSGPNFAQEVTAGKPAATTIAGNVAEEPAATQNVRQALQHRYFRCYLSDDLIGVQVAGAFKNVVAIACGIAHGMGLGNNAVAALLSRGLVEIRRLGLAMGAKSDTFLGLAGVGDMVLTCSNPLSRNFSLGLALGHGKSLGQIQEEHKAVMEGVYTVQALYHLQQEKGLALPVAEAIFHILYQNLAPSKAFEVLLHRASAEEIW